MKSRRRLLLEGHQSQAFSYSILEKRQLLAADLSGIEFSDDTGLVRTLADPVPMQDRFDVLRAVVGAEQENTFRRTSLERDILGFAHLKHQQFHNNIPIEGATYTTHIKDQQVVSVSGAFIDYSTVDIDNDLGEDGALDAALDFVGADLYMWESLQHDHPPHEYSPGCTCCSCAAQTEAAAQQHHHHHAHDHDLYSDQPPVGELTYLPTADGSLALTWKFDVYAVAPLSRQNIFVDAGSGEILETHNLIHHADVNADGTSLYDGTVDFLADDSQTDYRLRQVTNGVETYDLNNGTNYGNATDITSPSTSFTNPDTSTGVQAHWGAEKTLEYFLLEHGRDSYDGNGAVLRSYVSYSTDYVNAFWDGSRMTYGDGNGTTYGPLVSLDIVGHEVAHGVTGNSAGLIYQNESGALNESFSDIFGEAIENFATGTNDWLMGDDIGIGQSGALRNMANPNQYGDPDTYFGDLWYTGTADNGGVHINSGVQNKWFYVLSVGEAGTNDNGDAYDVTGIGMQDAGAIAYRNLSVYLNQSSDYPEAREGALQSAIDIFGADSPQYAATAAAWDAVGVYEPVPPEFNFVDAKSLGAGIYRSSLSDSLNVGEVAIMHLDVDTNQNVSIQVTSSNGLTPSVEIRDPSGQLVGSQTGSAVVLQDISIESSGRYTIQITGDASTSGDFEAIAILNSGIEAETALGVSNNTIGSAQELNSTAVSFGNDSVDRLSVFGTLEGQSALASEGFESGSLGSNWTSSSSTADGRILVTNAFSSEGDYSLFMDVTATNTFNLNEAIMTVDLDPADAPVLTFSHAEWGDETHLLPDTFTGSANGDGVAISADGTNWVTIMTGTDDSTAANFTDVSFDLLAIAEEAGITLGNNFQIKFQQYDNWPFDDDGRAYDDIQIIPRQAAGDWFKFDLEPNEIANVTASPVAGIGDVQIKLFDSEGNLVASGISSDNYNGVINDISSPTGGTWYAQVTGDLGMQYSVVVARGAGIDVEPNDAANPMAIDELDGVFGFVSNITSAVADPDAAENQQLISGFFPGVTLSNPINGGDIFAPVAGFAPTGDQVYGATPTGSDGFRANDREFQADFHYLQTSVSIDIGSDDNSDVGFLRAYDSQGNLLEEQVSDALSTGNFQTLTITRATPEIAYIIAAGVGTDITPLDNLNFSTGSADTDHYTVDLLAGEIISISGLLPGAGPFYFANGLDQEESQLRIELIDPNGNSVAIDSSEIEHTAAVSGTWQIGVSANSSEGEYLIRHSINHLPVAVDDNVSVDEDILLNIAVLDNDSEIDGDTLTVDSITQPANGQAGILADGTINYQPEVNFFGTDSFTYTISDSYGLTATATVNIQVNSVNDAPKVTLSANTVAENTDTTNRVLIGSLNTSDVDSTGLTLSMGDATGNDNSKFEIVDSKLYLIAGETIDFETKPQYSVLIEVSDGDLTTETPFTIVVEDRTEVAELTIGDGSDHSRIDNLTLRFDNIVDLQTGALTLTHRGNGQTVDLDWTIDNSSGSSIVTVSFTGAMTEASGSLIDGNYELNVNGSLLGGAIEGSDFVWGDQESHNFYRLFGDIDGNRFVNVFDLLGFRRTYLLTSSDPEFDARFDNNGDGNVNIFDLLRFRQNFLKRLEWS